MGAPRIRVRKLTLQPDNTVNEEGNGEEVVWWKRVKTRIDTEQGDDRGQFEAILDLRSRVLRFLQKDPAVMGVDQLARGVIHEMASFSTSPLSKLVQQRPEGVEGQSIWMAIDAELVSGLLHQVKESGPFIPRSGAPVPPTLREVLGEITVAIDENLAASFEWTQGDNMNPLLNVGFNAAAWQAHEHLILPNLDSTDARRRLVEFFEQTEAYVDILRRAKRALAAQHGAAVAQSTGALPDVDMRPYTEWARLGVRHGSHSYKQTGLKLGRELIDYTTGEQRAEMKHLGK